MSLVFEMCHLSHAHENKFLLVKQLFNIILNNDKIIYVWESRNKLLKFTKLNLFTDVQCRLPEFINFQLKFQKNWQKNHPHQPTTTPLNQQDNNCLCKSSIGK